MTLRVNIPTRIEFVRQAPWPVMVGDVRFRRPGDLSNSPVEHLKVVAPDGEPVKIGIPLLAHRMLTRQAETGNQPLIIEAPPVTLDRDITDFISRASLADGLQNCHALYFCTDIYDLNGELVDSYAAAADPGPQPRPDIFLNSRLPDNNYRNGLGYFYPLAVQLTRVSAWRQAKDDLLVLPFLHSLQTAAAVDSLLKNTPLEELEARTLFLTLLRNDFSRAQRYYGIIQRSASSGNPARLTDEMFNLYSSLSQKLAVRTEAN